MHWGRGQQGGRVGKLSWDNKFTVNGSIAEYHVRGEDYSGEMVG